MTLSQTAQTNHDHIIALLEQYGETPEAYGHILESHVWKEKMAELIPAHMHAGLVKWVCLGVKPGDFLTALLKGSLFDACRRADDVNFARLQDWVKFLHNYSPGSCFGSEIDFNKWAAHKGLVFDFPEPDDHEGS